MSWPMDGESLSSVCEFAPNQDGGVNNKSKQTRACRMEYQAKKECKEMHLNIFQRIKLELTRMHPNSLDTNFQTDYENATSKADDTEEVGVYHQDSETIVLAHAQNNSEADVLSSHDEKGFHSQGDNPALLSGNKASPEPDTSSLSCRANTSTAIRPSTAIEFNMPQVPSSNFDSGSNAAKTNGLHAHLPPLAPVQNWYSAAVLLDTISSIECLTISAASMVSPATCCAEAKREFSPLSTFRNSETKNRKKTLFESNGDVVKVSENTIRDVNGMYQECCPPNSARSSGVSIANCGAQAKCQIANNSPLKADDMSENASKETLSIACRSWTSQPQKNNSWSSKHETEYKRLFELHRLGSTSNCSHLKEAHSISPSKSAWNSKGENPRGHEVNEAASDDNSHGSQDTASQDYRPLLRSKTFSFGTQASDVTHNTSQDGKNIGICKESFSRTSKSRFSLIRRKQQQGGKLARLSSTTQHSKYKHADITCVTVNLPIGETLGIKLGGGYTTAYGDSGIFITEIEPSSCAHGLIRKSDMLLTVNDLAFEGITLLEANKCLENLPSGKTRLELVRAKRRIPFI